MLPVLAERGAEVEINQAQIEGESILEICGEVFRARVIADFALVDTEGGYNWNMYLCPECWSQETCVVRGYEYAPYETQHCLYCTDCGLLWVWEKVE